MVIKICQPVDSAKIAAADGCGEHAQGLLRVDVEA
jgi:hypothetical protein